MESSKGNTSNTENGETSAMKCMKRNVNDGDNDIIEVKRKRILQPKTENGQQVFETNLCNLPDELLVFIFSHLDSVDLMDVCLTCERFFDICFEKSLWKVINIRDINFTENIFKQYMNFAGVHTEEIYIIGEDSMERMLSFDNLYQIKVKCPNLRALHLENQALDALEIFVSVFPSTLKELSLANCTLLNEKYIQRFFSGIDSYFTNLETLILTNCCWFSTHSIMAVSKLPKLKFLYLDGCLQLNNFMPYLSLSTRYGFKHLELVDLRRTFVSDSEVSCFNASKTLKALYLERIVIKNQKKRNYSKEYMTEEILNKLSTECLQNELTCLTDIVPLIEQNLDHMDTPKSRILKMNFGAVMQELGKSYTKIGFHRLFCTFKYLEKLVNLEAINSDTNETTTIGIINSTIQKNEFKIQKRIKQSNENIENIGTSSSSSTTAEDTSITEYTVIDTIRTPPSFTNCAEFIKSCLNPQPSCSSRPSAAGSDQEMCRIICTNVVADTDQKTNMETPLLDKEFIRSLRRITRQSTDVDNIEYHDIDFHTDVIDNTVIVALGNRHYFDRNTSFLNTEVSTIGNRTVHALFNPRAECSNLERVSFRGYQNITDEGLFYLTHAPQTIYFIDVRGTGVTRDGCSRFQIQRPWCELKCDFEL